MARARLYDFFLALFTSGQAMQTGAYELLEVVEDKCNEIEAVAHKGRARRRADTLIQLMEANKQKHEEWVRGHLKTLRGMAINGLGLLGVGIVLGFTFSPWCWLFAVLSLAFIPCYLISRKHIRARRTIIEGYTRLQYRLETLTVGTVN